MNAPTTFTRPYGVTECSTCEGKGSVWNGHGRGGNDPDSWDVECSDCGGEPVVACPVCAFDVPVAGYDCFVCELVNDIPDAALRSLDKAKLAASVISAAVAEHRRIDALHVGSVVA